MTGLYGRDYDEDGNLVAPPERLPAPSNPMAVARKLITDYQIGAHVTLRRWRGGWMQWTGPPWAEAEETIIRAWAYKRLEHAEYMDTSGKVPEDKPCRAPGAAHPSPAWSSATRTCCG